MRALRPWGRIVGCVLSGLGLLGFPIGTAINAYILYLFLSKKGRTVFAPEYQAVIAATPDVKYRTSILVWIFLALLVALACVRDAGELFRQMIERGHHDLGGRPAGKVERDEHDYELWERRIDAMAVLLGFKKLLTVDQRRKNIEALPPEMYDSLSYYERWLMSMAQSLIERGLITTEELSRKMLARRARAATTTWAGCRPARWSTTSTTTQQWERRVDALMMILSGIKGPKRMITVDELRKNIEALPPDAYERMNYYDRWVTSITQTLIQRGVITTEELARKMAANQMVEAKFKPGERVKVMKAYPLGHVRTPYYIRGCTGTVERICGAFPQSGGAGADARRPADAAALSRALPAEGSVARLPGERRGRARGRNFPALAASLA